jgi:hypothetical protein
MNKTHVYRIKETISCLRVLAAGFDTCIAACSYETVKGVAQSVYFLMRVISPKSASATPALLSRKPRRPTKVSEASVVGLFVTLLDLRKQIYLKNSRTTGLCKGF